MASFEGKKIGGPAEKNNSFSTIVYFTNAENEVNVVFNYSTYGSKESIIPGIRILRKYNTLFLGVELLISKHRNFCKLKVLTFLYTFITSSQVSIPGQQQKSRRNISLNFQILVKQMKLKKRRKKLRNNWPNTANVFFCPL